MALIRDVVQTALTTGFLTIEAENQLRQLLASKYEQEDFLAFMILQEAAMTGQVKQESRERLKANELAVASN
ncbi:MAG: hypothetical protein JOZ78_24345 [Chroococcidiopsidaceae cyanobacterium CP_BM_ER_R8_30]|nr:hypothetical protein [Chroococcidiopsidaceae cyanobacterium CP_BM_ER_R8_30]